MTEKKYDIAVLGAGPGGYSAAIRAAQLGKKVVIIEKDKVGGTCLNRGCIPTKSILASIELFSKIKRALDFGIEVEKFSINMDKVIQRKNRIVARLTKGVEYLLKQNKIDLIKGEGKLKEPGKIELRAQNTELRAQKIILATGSEPMDIPGFPVDGKKIINSNHILDLKDPPKTMEILGCGVIGLQFARIFSDLGTKINICEALPTALPMIDEEVTESLLKTVKKKEIEIHMNTKLSKPSGKEVTFVAAGRKVNNEGLKDAGVELIKDRYVKVNEKMETNLPGVYATGDITGINMLAHVAYAQGKVAAENACRADSRIGSTEIDYSVVPMCIFTDPEVSAVGITESQAKEKGIEVKIGKFPFMALGKARAIDETEGFVKVVADAKTDKVLGVHMIGPQATILIAEAAMALKLGAKAEDIANLIHAHPTLPEAVQEAAESIFGQAIHI